ncbi:MAG: hypothetical protein COV66_12155 [Nitrospinae bacterium CG11_big_fil_rev_8_21_14_0_20_45_15]|nr:MAG: hypothetical protein COV66_12155 [Nitrospinae bacterium CG11_big_fil_rev_8_21_14_0_20_45_15]
MVFRRIKTALKYFLAVLLLACLSLVGLVFWNLTDVDRLKELAIMQLENLTGREVVVGAAELDWSKGVSVKLLNVSIGGVQGSGPECSARSVWVVAKILPLLEKQIEIQKVIVQGAYLLLERNASGDMRLGGWAPKPGTNTPSRWANVFKVNAITEVSFKDSSLKFVDHANTAGDDSPRRISLENFHISIRKPLLQKKLSFVLGGEMPNEGPPTFINTEGTLGAEILTGDFSNLSIAGNMKVQGLLLQTVRPYLKFVSSDFPANSRLSFETDFEGGRSWQINGKAQYSLTARDGSPTLSNRSTSNRVSANFEAFYNENALELKNVSISAGQFHLKGNAQSKNIFASDPQIKFSVSTDPFYIDQSPHYLPLKVIPERVHDILHSRFQGGTIKVKSLHFDGTLNQLKGLGTEENDRLISAEMDLDRVDWLDPLPDFKKVTGSLKLHQGDSEVLITNTTFVGLPISKISGSIKNLLHAPVADLQVKNQVEIQAFKKFLIRILKDAPFVKTLNQLEEIKGEGIVTVTLKGSLENDSDLSIKGHLTIDDATIKRRGLKEIITTVRGEVFYDQPSAIEKSKTGVTTTARLDNFSGKLKQSSFSNFNANLDLDSKDPYRKLSTKLHLNLVDVPSLLADFPLSKPAEELLKFIEFTGGFVDIERFVTTDPKKPGSEKAWGSARLKNASFKYRNRFQPLMNVTGTIKFADQSPFLLENITGWYGNAPLHLNGNIDRSAPSRLSYALNFDLDKLLSADLKDIPQLQSLKFEGPLHFKGKLTGTVGTDPASPSNPSYHLAYELDKILRNEFTDVSYLKNWKFEGPLHASGTLNGQNDEIEFDQIIDLTPIAYQQESIFSKPAGVRNPLHLQGIYSPAKGLQLKKIQFDLEKIRFDGSASISAGQPSLFDLNVKAPDFDLASASRYFKSLSFAKQGTLSLNFQLNGPMESGNKNLTVAEANFKNVLLNPSNASFPPGIFSGKFEKKANDYSLKEGQWTRDDSQLFFNGNYRDSLTPQLNLQLTAGTLKIEDSKKEQDENEDSGLTKLIKSDIPLFTKGTVSVNLALDSLVYKKLNMKKVHGQINIKDKKLTVSKFNFGENNSIHTEGTFAFHKDKPMEFKNRLSVKNMHAQNFIASLGSDFKNGLTGEIKNLSASLSGQGDKWDEISSSLTGSIELHMEAGNFHKTQFKQGIETLIGNASKITQTENKETSEDELNKKSPKKEDDNIPFDKVIGKFMLIGGVAKTDDLIFESPGRRTSLVGKFDLVQNSMDLVVGVAPLADLDKFLTQIPLVGKILTAGDEASLLKAYYTAKGPLTDPEVTAIPFVSLGKKVMGIFQGILQTPQEILSLPDSGNPTN